MQIFRFLIITSIISIFVSSGTPVFSKESLSVKTDFKTIPIKHFNFSAIDKDTHIWSAMYIASNNKIYIGLCTHGDAANVYEFDIKTEQMRQLANLTILLGERGKGIWTNGKIHVRMQELDGFIYFGSFCEDNGPPAIDASSYGGPYWFRINMKTGQVEPLSKINSFWGLLGQAMDNQRRIIYGLAEDGHLYRYFIDKNYTDDLGRVDNWDICRTIFSDDVGNVYGSTPPGKIWKYDASQDRLLDLEFLQLPINLDSRTIANPMLDRRAQWRVVEWDPVDKAAYGIVGGNNILFKYDVHQGQEGKIAALSQMCVPQFRDGNPFNVPHATLAMTISQKERKIYYITVIGGDFDYGGNKTELIRDSKIKEQIKPEKNMPPLAYMISYNLKTGERKDIGILRAKDGRYAYGMGAAQTDSSGRIWFVGAFEEPDEKYVVRKMNGEFPYSLGLGCYDPFSK